MFRWLPVEQSHNGIRFGAGALLMAGDRNTIVGIFIDGSALIQLQLLFAVPVGMTVRSAGLARHRFDAAAKTLLPCCSIQYVF